MSKILYIHKFNPVEIGHGGNHRCYQILHDLQTIVGKENVITYKPNLVFGTTNQPTQHRLTLIKNRINAKFHSFLKNVVTTGRQHKLLPLIILEKAIEYPFGIVSIQDYEKFISRIKNLDICVADHPAFFPFIQKNLNLGIPTIYCPQNIETFDMHKVELNKEWYLDKSILNLIKEIKLLALCNERLFISKVESGFFGGLGLASKYYPYLPVGTIRQRLETIRSKRQKSIIDPGLFLMIGTASHISTGNSFEWFIEQACAHGLPDGVRVIIGGLDTEKYINKIPESTNVDVCGWIEQDELDNLLVQASAVLIPQDSGFGALTRIPELAYAGITAIVSSHSTYALDTPPGIDIVNGDWGDWFNKIQRAFNVQ